MKVSSLNLIVCAIYRQPNDVVGNNISTSEQFESLINQLSAVLDSQQVPLPNVLIGGDFNLPHISWPACSPSPGASRDEKLMIALLNNFCSRHFLVQLVGEQTHQGGNILDIVLTNNPDMFPTVSFFPTSPISSHYFGLIETTIQASPRVEENMPSSPSKFDEVNLFSPQTDWQSIKSNLAAIDWPAVLENKTPEEMLHSLTTHCENVASAFSPTKKREEQRKLSPGSDGCL